MKRLVTAASLAAFFVALLPSSSAAWQRGHLICEATFAPWQAKHLATVTYLGVRKVSRAEHYRLHTTVRCQIDAADVVPIGRYVHRLWLAHWHRQHPPRPPAVVLARSMSALEACIISHESGGNPQATNGQYAGIGQWSPAAWAQDGGTRYASSPLGASYAEQEAVLRGEGEAGMRQQQAQYDGCLT